MTTQDRVPPPQGRSGTTPPTGSTSSPDDTSDEARQEAREVADEAQDRASAVASHASDQASQVASSAQDSAQNVADEARSQARDVMSEARTQLREQSEQGMERAGSQLRSTADQLRALSEGRIEDAGPLADQAGALARRVGDWADRIQGRSVDQVSGDVRDYASRKPSRFLAACFAAGVAAGRLGRNVQASDEIDLTGDDQSGGSGGTTLSSGGRSTSDVAARS